MTLTLVGGFASTLSFPACAWLPLALPGYRELMALLAACAAAAGLALLAAQPPRSARR